MGTEQQGAGALRVLVCRPHAEGQGHCPQSGSIGLFVSNKWPILVWDGLEQQRSHKAHIKKSVYKAEYTPKSVKASQFYQNTSFCAMSQWRILT